MAGAGADEGPGGGFGLFGDFGRLGPGQAVVSAARAEDLLVVFAEQQVNLARVAVDDGAGVAAGAATGCDGELMVAQVWPPSADTMTLEIRPLAE